MVSSARFSVIRMTFYTQNKISKMFFSGCGCVQNREVHAETLNDGKEV